MPKMIDGKRMMQVLESCVRQCNKVLVEASNEPSRHKDKWDRECAREISEFRCSVIKSKIYAYRYAIRQIQFAMMDDSPSPRKRPVVKRKQP